MKWFRVEFQLEDFGHHNAQLVSKNYLTYPFFTPVQVYYAFTFAEDLVSHPEYEEVNSLSTPAVAVSSYKVVQKLYTIRNSPLDLSKYPNFGKVQYIPPGTRFCTYSQHKPKYEVIMIGKKRRVARILSVRKVDCKEEHFRMTSPDLVSHDDFRKLNPSEYQILAMSARWVYGRFKVERGLSIGEDFFVSPIIKGSVGDSK